MIDLICAGPNHAAYEGEPDWQTVLGQGDQENTSMVCTACWRHDFDRSPDA